MTDDEKRRLQHVEDMVRDIHRKLFEPGDDGDAPLVTRIMTIVRAAESGQWAAKWTIRILFGALTFLGGLLALWKSQ
jgi:hypothetical protein